MQESQDELKMRLESIENNTEQENREDFTKKIEIDLKKKRKYERKKRDPLLNHKMLQARI